MPEKGKKIGVINCEDQEKWGYEDGCVKLIITTLSANMGLPVDMFVPLQAISGQLPSKEDFADYWGFIIGGSHYSANDNKDWMVRLEEFIRECKREWESHSEGTSHAHSPKIVGICFGHQVIGKALGGKVGKNPCGKFVIGVEKMLPNEAFKKKPFAHKLCGNGDSTFCIAESHGDSVIELPPGADVLAGSASCDYEIVQYNNGILGIQGHPELPLDMLQEKILNVLVEKKVLSKDEEEWTLKSFKLPVHGDELLKALSSFILSEN